MRAEDEADCDVSAELLLQECSKTLFQKRSNCSRNAVMPVNSLEQEMLKTYQEHSVDHKISPEVRSPSREDKNYVISSDERSTFYPMTTNQNLLMHRVKDR
ncbi:MAG: hypothetical protein HC815_26685 [Richelia sp. RM1_1_1]|nr:hypothetical protein [Richelia sp. RM1_1_1]